MEAVKFLIRDISPNMCLCRIVADDYRQVFRDIADGACITSLDGIIDEMDRITMACAEIGFSAIFEIQKTR